MYAIRSYYECGYAPLIKVARDLGIEWHLLADGDPAGVKYMTGARSQLRGERERDRLTLLPSQDIEHFLFEQSQQQMLRLDELLVVAIRQALRIGQCLLEHGGEFIKSHAALP